MQLIPILVAVVLLWLLVIRPQRQRVRAQQALLQSLEVGDEVVTAGGMLGTVVAMDDETVTVEIAPGTAVRMLRPAITRRVTRPPTIELDDPLDDDVDHPLPSSGEDRP